MAVEILESCMVTPGESATPKHGVWLSNLDLLVARSHTPTVYVYRPSPGPAFFSPDVLKAALSKVLVPFYPLAGRLARDGAGRPEIHCTGDGALLSPRAPTLRSKISAASSRRTSCAGCLSPRSTAATTAPAFWPCSRSHHLCAACK